jgi:hypothetical protein
MIDVATSPMICPICNHPRLTEGRVCRVCIGVEDEAGNLISYDLGPTHDIETVTELVIDKPKPVAPKRSHKPKPKRANGALSSTGHIKTKICPICRSPLKPWDQTTCGSIRCIIDEQRIASTKGPKKPCSRCTYPWPDTLEFFYRRGGWNPEGKKDPICKGCKREEANQRAKHQKRGVRGRRRGNG